jgi:hypothetical protein
MKKHFTLEDIQVLNKHVKKYSTLPAIKKYKLKAQCDITTHWGQCQICSADVKKGLVTCCR